MSDESLLPISTSASPWQPLCPLPLTLLSIPPGRGPGSICPSVIGLVHLDIVLQVHPVVTFFFFFFFKLSISLHVTPRCLYPWMDTQVVHTSDSRRHRRSEQRGCRHLRHLPQLFQIDNPKWVAGSGGSFIFIF